MNPPICRQSTQSLEASLDQRLHESLHHSAEREQRFLTEAQQEVACLKSQIQRQTQNMVQMASESSSTGKTLAGRKKDEDVEQFKEELQEHYERNFAREV